MVKVPKRGPVLVKLDNGNQLDLWYDREIRLWTLQLKDSEGNQIGPGHGGTASHSHSREDAVAELNELAEAANSEHQSIAHGMARMRNAMKNGWEP